MMFMGRYAADYDPETYLLYSDRGTWFVVGFYDGTPQPITRDRLDLIRRSRVRTRPLPLIIHEGDGGNSDFTPVGRHAIDLSGVDFERVQFHGADFRGAKLTGARFVKARLTECRFDKGALAGLDFSGAHLSNCDFSGFDLTGTNFSGATFSDVTFRGATLSDCDFREAKMAGANFAGAKFAGGTFAGANLARAVFGGASPATFSANVDFAGANLELADFNGTSLLKGEVRSARPRFGTSPETRTKLAGARIHTGFFGNDWSNLDLTGAEVVFDPDFDGDGLVANSLILPNGDFAGRSLKRARFRFAVLPGARFANCNLEDAEFSGAVLVASGSSGAADFSGANLGLAEFGGANLRGVGFSGAVLKGAKFASSQLALTDFTNAFLAEADFTSIQDRRMQGVSFNNAFLLRAKFQDVEIGGSSDGRPTSFAGAYLLGTNFTGAKLGDVTLTNAKLPSQPGTINVIIAPPWDPHEPMTYPPTQLPPEITNERTTCPNGQPGRCTREQLTTPVPDTWTQPSVAQ